MSIKVACRCFRRRRKNGFGVPCLLIPSKNDMRSNPMALPDSPKVCRDMGIEAHILVSVKSEKLYNVYKRIINAAERPHLSIPETENGRYRKQYLQTVNRSLVFVSGRSSYTRSDFYLNERHKRQLKEEFGYNFLGFSFKHSFCDSAFKK